MQNVAPLVDPNAVNSWGIVVTGNTFWVAQNHAGVLSHYSENGTNTTIVPPAVKVPAASGDPVDIGSPTGLVYNKGPNFINPSTGQPYVLLTATEDGTIAAYDPSFNLANAVTVINQSGAGSIYKGLAITNTTLYATDFHNGKVDTFDGSFNGPLNGFPFIDPTIPAGYAPFNIVYLNGLLYVTYALQDANAEDDVPGPGNGYVSIFDINGNFIARLISRGYLNSPWAIVPAHDRHNRHDRHDRNDRNDNCHECHEHNDFILIGNFGDGKINKYTLDGQFVETLMRAECTPVTIPGLWGLAYNHYSTKLYFASGPNGENDGLIGYITPRC